MGPEDRFVLRAELHGHSADVRALASDNINGFFSASRDGTAKHWQAESDSGAGFMVTSEFSGHAGFVNSVAYLPASAVFPTGAVATGGQDNVIRVFASSGGASADPQLTLIGHTGNVCALSHGIDASGRSVLVSGSWDNTARVWDASSGECVGVLSGHTAAVWATLVLENGCIVTCSADKQVRIWRAGSVVAALDGHTAPVRGACLVPGIGFATCSNDWYAVNFSFWLF